MGLIVKNLCLGNLFLCLGHFKGIVWHDSILGYSQPVACCHPYSATWLAAIFDRVGEEIYHMISLAILIRGNHLMRAHQRDNSRSLRYFGLGWIFV